MINKVLKKLPTDIQDQLIRVLEPDEEVLDYRKEPWSYFRRNRWDVLTTKRMYLIKKYFFGLSYDVVQILLAEAHFEMLEGIMFDTVYVRVSQEPDNILSFFKTNRVSTVEFFERIEKTREGEPEANFEAQAELEALAKVFYEHAISKEEYEQEKKKILDKL